MIEKKLHFIWIGDESKCPHNCIDTWREKNPAYEVKIWGNEDLASYGWNLFEWMREMAPRELAGVADLMRYEILYREGGITIDADSVCIRSLEDWLLETNEFVSWENEHLMDGGLLGISIMGSVKESPFFGHLIRDFLAEKVVIDDPAWKITGPLRFTNTWRKYKYPLTIYPSHYFYAHHHSGYIYEGGGVQFAKQLWGSTNKSYDSLHEKEL
jgi:mannosyltransferase OCH1-like enzyme